MRVYDGFHSNDEFFRRSRRPLYPTGKYTIYIIGDARRVGLGKGDGTLGIKIGGTWNNPKDRLKSLQSGNPVPLCIYGTMEGMPDDEVCLKWMFLTDRINGEWFSITKEIAELISLMADSCSAREAIAELQTNRLIRRIAEEEHIWVKRNGYCGCIWFSPNDDGEYEECNSPKGAEQGQLDLFDYEFFGMTKR